MNKILNLFSSNNPILKEASNTLNQFYQKIQTANRHRYALRLRNEKIRYPPALDGNDNVQQIARKAPAKFRRVLGVRPHPEFPVFPDEYSIEGPPKGRVYEKFPFKYTVEKGKIYWYCTCGYSNNQPFCDDSHKMLWTTHMMKKFPKYRPIKYIAEETKDVYFCNCKKSSSRPFCDGTHKTDLVQKDYSVK